MARPSTPDLSSAWHAQAPPPPPSPSNQGHGRRLSYVPQGPLNIGPGSILSNEPATTGGNLPFDSHSPAPEVNRRYSQQQPIPPPHPATHSYYSPQNAPPQQQYYQQQAQYQNQNYHPQHSQQSYYQQNPSQAQQQYQQPYQPAPAPQQVIQQRPLPAPTHHLHQQQQQNAHPQQYQPPHQLHHSNSWSGHPPPQPQPPTAQYGHPTQPQPQPSPISPTPSSVGSIRRNLPQPPSAQPSTPQPHPIPQQPVNQEQAPAAPSTLSRAQTVRNAAEDIMSRGVPRRGVGSRAPVKPLWNSGSSDSLNGSVAGTASAGSISSLQSSNSFNNPNGNGNGSGNGLSNEMEKMNLLTQNQVQEISSSSSQSATPIQSSPSEINPPSAPPILRSPSPSYAGRPTRKSSTGPSVPPLSSSSGSAFGHQQQDAPSGSRPPSRKNSLDNFKDSETSEFVRPPSRGPREDVKLGRERRASTDFGNHDRSSSPAPPDNFDRNQRSSSPAPGARENRFNGNVEEEKSTPPARYGGYVPEIQVENQSRSQPQQPQFQPPIQTQHQHQTQYQPVSQARSNFTPTPPQIQVQNVPSAPSIVEPTTTPSPSFNFSGPDESPSSSSNLGNGDVSIVVPQINLPGQDDDEEEEMNGGPMISISSVGDDSVSEGGHSSTSRTSNNAPSISVSHSGQIATPQRASSTTTPASNHPSNPNFHSSNHSQSQSNGPGAASASSIGSGKNCGGCKKWTGGRVLNAMSQVWHPQCFACKHCKTPLEHVAFYEHEGNPYCHFDYHELFSIRCFHCRTPIVDERFIRIMDDQLTGGGNGDEKDGNKSNERFYHELHFFCANCGDPFLDPKAAGSAAGSDPNAVQADENGRVVFGGMGFVVKNGYAYCERCHQNLHYPRCKTCKLPILAEVLSALGSKYHPECFTCDSCGQAFQDERMFVRGKKKYDEECYKILLKNEL